MTSRRQRYLYRPVYRKVLRPVGYCLLSPIILAFIVAECCFGSPWRYSDHRTRARERQERLDKLDREYAPKPLVPEQRPRPLTRCTPTDPYNPQENSPLFKLPAELRLRIFHEALGGNVVHLLFKPHRAGHVLCCNPYGTAQHDGALILTPGDPDRRCFVRHVELPPPRGDQQRHQHQQQQAHPHVSATITPSSPSSTRFHDECTVVKTCHRTSDPDSCRERKAHSMAGDLLPKDSIPLSLLLSCRRAYCEAIEPLYRTNVFDFNHPHSFVIFANSILPERLAAVRSIQIFWNHVAHSRDRWRELWGSVVTRRRMPGLQHVRLVVEWYYWRQEWEEEELLGPIAENLRGLKSFEIEYLRFNPDFAADRADGRSLSELGRRLKEVVCAAPSPPTADVQELEA